MQLETNISLKNFDTFSFIKLKKTFALLYGKPPPKTSSHGFLIANIAYRMQETNQGSLSTKTKNKLTKIAKELDRNPTYDPVPKQDIRAGTRLIREWQGDVHEVTVREDGFVYRGQRYRSLSKIATEITGTKWSGLVFFGLKKKAMQVGAKHGQ